MEELLSKIKKFASAAHGDQMRKYAPEQYIVHPVRVKEICSDYINEMPVLAAALLHDVLEDTDTDEREVLIFLNTLMNFQETERTLNLVIELTDVFTKKEFPQWDHKTRKNKEAERISTISTEAQTIKYADIIDNSQERIDYAGCDALSYLLQVQHVLSLAKNGDKKLYNRASTVVREGLESLNRPIGGLKKNNW